MKLKFIVADLPYSAGSMADFLHLSDTMTGEMYKGMGSSILTLYPELDASDLKNLSQAQTANYIQEKLREKYEALLPQMSEKAQMYQTRWDDCEKEIERSLGDIFHIDMAACFNDMVGRVNMNPICPRFLEDSSFDIIYLYSDKGAVCVSLHEITHFVWFKVWQNLFHDSPEFYEQPHLPWILSELAIDAILTDVRLNKFIWNEQIAKQPAYPEFYEINTRRGKLIDVMREIYKNSSIEGFMQKGYDFCKENKGLFEKLSA